MTAHEICYLDGDGALTYKLLVNSDNDGRAKALAQAINLPRCKRLEIWERQ